MTDLPSDIEEIKVRLGLVTNRVMGLPEIRKCQHQLAEWFVTAAEIRWTPKVWAFMDADSQFETARKAAIERWPGIAQIADALNAAERHIIRGSEPLA